MSKLLLAIALVFLTATNASAKVYAVDYAQSKIAFSGTHVGEKFIGKFGEWIAQIDFDPKKLDSSSIKASFTTASAVTGNKMYDGTLPQVDWFNSAEFPKAEFVSDSIKSNGGDKYTATGILTIRGIAKPAQIEFNIADIAKTPVKVQGTLVIKRSEYDIGKKSDPKAEWVSDDIQVKLDISAIPKI